MKFSAIVIATSTEGQKVESCSGCCVTKYFYFDVADGSMNADGHVSGGSREFADEMVDDDRGVKYTIQRVQLSTTKKCGKLKMGHFCKAR